MAVAIAADTPLRYAAGTHKIISTIISSQPHDEARSRVYYIHSHDAATGALDDNIAEAFRHYHSPAYLVMAMP